MSHHLIRGGVVIVAILSFLSGTKIQSKSLFEAHVEKVATKEVVLKRWIPLSKQVTRSDVVYVIKRKFNLKGEILCIPNGCCLRFKGGRLSNGTIHGLKTTIENAKDDSFMQIQFTGTWLPTFVSPEWFGAIGDGFSDDTQALQKAADFAIDATLMLTNKKSYKYTKGISIHGNTKIEGNGSKIIKACYSAFLHNIHCNDDIVDYSICINGLTGITLDDSYRGLWLWMVGVKGLTVSNCSFSNHTPLEKEQIPQWCITVSGEDIDISKCNIDNSKGGAFSDGIHLFNAKNCAIHDCVIIAEDDCIGFAPEIPKEQLEFNKFNFISNNIIISGNRLTGNMNCIRFEVRENAPKLFAYQNVTICDNILDGTKYPVGSFLYLHDYREESTTYNSSFLIDRILIDGNLVSERKDFIEIFGKNPVFVPKDVSNIYDVKISNLYANLSGYENFIRCLGTNYVRLENCSFIAIEQSSSHIAIRDCNDVEIEDCEFVTYTQYPFIQTANSTGCFKNNKLERASKDNNAGIGIYLDNNDFFDIEGNVISNFAIGLRDLNHDYNSELNRYVNCRINVQRE